MEDQKIVFIQTKVLKCSPIIISTYYLLLLMDNYLLLMEVRGIKDLKFNFGLFIDVFTYKKRHFLKLNNFS